MNDSCRISLSGKPTTMIIKNPLALQTPTGSGETPTTKSSISFAILAREMQKGKENMAEKLTISVPEAARRLGISKPSAYALARRADFPAFHIGERIVVYEAGLEEWVRKQAEQKGAEA